MEARLETLRQEDAARPKVKLSMLYDYFGESQLPGERLFNVRIPRSFEHRDLSFHEQTLDSEQKPYPAERLWPLGVRPPGYYWTYESAVAEDSSVLKAAADEADGTAATQTRWAFTLCIGALPLQNDVDLAEVELFFENLNAAYRAAGGQGDAAEPDTVYQSRAIPITNTAGAKTEWRKVRLEVDMPFVRYEGRREAGTETKPGVVEIYFSQQNDHMIVLEGKWPQGMDDATLMPHFLPLMASTVKVQSLTPATADETADPAAN